MSTQRHERQTAKMVICNNPFMIFESLIQAPRNGTCFYYFLMSMQRHTYGVNRRQMMLCNNFFITYRKR